MFRARREIQIPPHYTPDHPDSSQAENLDTEDKYNKQLVVDPRPVMVKPREKILEPRFNRLYGTGRSKDDWRYFIDNYAKGTLTTVANTPVTTTVTLTNQPNWRLEQWPGGVHLYLCIRKFSMAPQSAITTVGAIDVIFVDQFGNTIPMGDFESNSNIAYDVDSIIPTPITDPGNTAVGSLITTLAGTTPTVSVYNWQLAFSAVYVLPTIEGYETESVHRVLPRYRQDA